MPNEQIINMEIQWTTDPATRWQQIRIEDWPRVADRGEPPIDREPILDGDGRVIGFTGTEVVIDETPGWIYRVDLQGFIFSGDHISVESFASHVEITKWNNDPNEPIIFTEPSNATIHRFYPEIIERTFRIDDRRTMKLKGFKHEIDIYVTSGNISSVDAPYCTGGQANVFDYATFIEPSGNITRHGIWITNDLLDIHNIYKASRWENWLAT